MARRKPDDDVELEMTLEEALWLRALVQNGPDDEDEYNREMRSSIFHALEDLQ